MLNPEAPESSGEIDAGAGPPKAIPRDEPMSESGDGGREPSAPNVGGDSAVDAPNARTGGDVVVGGGTESTDLPLTTGALRTTGGGREALLHGSRRISRSSRT